MALCLVVEDHEPQRRTTCATLRHAGYQLAECGKASDAVELCRLHRPEIIVLDLGLPDMEGIEVLPLIFASSPLSRVVVVTGRDDVRQAVAALRAGARHYLVKPWDRDELLLILEREVAAVNLAEVGARAPDEVIFWGANPTMGRLRDHVGQLSQSPDTPVLIVGETGTGKEVIARELHRVTESPGSFVPLNCAAIPSQLLESELFGHERGAFTGADHRRRGVTELADQGTLFLDEIGEMDASLQAKLLRFLQDHSFRRLGSETELVSRCRVVAATHADLEARRGDGGFRTDLFFRLAVVKLEVPPLRARGEDILPLAHVLLRRIADRVGRPLRTFSPRAEKTLRAHPWPGNVRELANRIERALVLGRGDALEPADLDLEQTASNTAIVGPAGVLEDPLRLRKLLDDEGWNISRAARRIGVARHQLRYRIESFGLARDG
jgi:DNA-binding NtrC family response regulator